MARRTLRTDAPEAQPAPSDGLRATRRPHLLDRDAPSEVDQNPALFVLEEASARLSLEMAREEPHLSDESHRLEEPHRIERLVQQMLLARTDVSFPALTVRRMPNGLCLQGIMETGDNVPDIANTVRSVALIDNILNQLVIRRHAEEPVAPQSDSDRTV